MARDPNQLQNDGGITRLKEGWIKKGGVNNPPQSPKPAPPIAMNPKPSRPTPTAKK
jgi:hypothetical protein